MYCGYCGTESADGAPECRTCGRPLSSVCVECGARSAPGPRFCQACGSPLQEPLASAHPSPEIEGERRQVSVLFADVKGSMQLQRQVDSDGWHDIMQRFFSILRDAVADHGGAVDKFTGDGIMATFGAPDAHEDHARRACLAALQMRGRLEGFGGRLAADTGLDFQVRLGISSGEAVIGALDADRRTYTALGHNVGVGQRMEAIAEPGSIYLSEDTARLIEGFFELRAVGSLEVRGVPGPMGVFELVGIGPARSDLDRSRSRGFSPLIGRAGVLDGLESALELARQGKGAVVAVRGEPGTGKSRVCHEFMAACRAQGLRVHHAEARWHTRRAPLLPLLELVRSHLGVTEPGDAPSIRRQAERALLKIDPGLAEDVALLWDLLGVPEPERPLPAMSVESRRARLLSLLSRILADPGGLVTVDVIEDLHALDPTSDRFLAELVEAVAGTRTLLLVNFRPEYSSPWLDLAHCHSIDLGALQPGDASHLVDELLGSDPSLDGLSGLIARRTGGNPFYIEETVRALVEEGRLGGPPGARRALAELDSIMLAPSVQSVINARIDRLGRDDRRVLQTAALIGRHFDSGLLDRALGGAPARRSRQTDQTLERLLAAGFLREVELGSGDERCFDFIHPLTREVAADSQLATHRKAVHAAVAGALEDIHRERLDEQAAVIAGHWEAADEPLTAAAWSARAAQWTALKDPLGALEPWAKVHDLVRARQSEPEAYKLCLQAISAQLNIGWRTGSPDEELRSLYDEAQGLAALAGDARTGAMLTAQYAMIRGSHGYVEDFCRLAEEAAAIARHTGDQSFARTVKIVSIPAFTPAGRLRDAERIGDELAAHIDRPDGFLPGFVVRSPPAYLLLGRAFVAMDLGRLAEAERLLVRAMALAEEHNDSEVAGWIPLYRCYLAAYRGLGSEAVRHGRRALEIATLHDGVFVIVQVWTALAFALLVDEEPTEAAESAREAIRLCHAWRATLWVEPRARAYLAQALVALGEPEAAVEHARLGVELAHERQALFHAIPAHVAMATALRARAETGQSAHSPAELDAQAGLDAQSERDIDAALADAAALIELTGALAEAPALEIERAAVARYRGHPQAESQAMDRHARLLAAAEQDEDPAATATPVA